MKLNDNKKTIQKSKSKHIERQVELRETSSTQEKLKEQNTSSLEQNFERQSRNKRSLHTDQSDFGIDSKNLSQISLGSHIGQNKKIQTNILPHSRSQSSLSHGSEFDSSSSLNMRRRAKDPRSYYPSNNGQSQQAKASASRQGITNPNAIDTTTYGYFEQRASSPTQVRNNHEEGVPLKQSQASVSPPRAHPSISEFMPSDQQYINFLLSGNHHRSPSGGGIGNGQAGIKIHHAQNTNPDSFFSQPMNLQTSKFMTYFSFVGTILLFLFGYLIEVQPLYIKGISPARTPLYRNLHGQYSPYSWVHFSARLRILENRTLSQQDTNHEEVQRMMESMHMVFEMKKEAKVAFKASALYFLIMILSYVYTQNHVLIHAHYQRMNFNLVGRLKGAIIMIPRHVLLLLRKYRRRNYHSNIDEVGVGPLNNTGFNTKRHGASSTGWDESFGDETGLSMRERKSNDGIRLGASSLVEDMFGAKTKKR